MGEAARRLAWLAATACLIGGLFFLDRHRAGPVTPLSACNLALTRSETPPADVLVIGSSRTGTAIDHVGLERLLAAEPGIGEPTVERIALGRSPLRANVALLENYLSGRGSPRVLVFELSFATPRTIDRIRDLGLSQEPEQFLFRRDANLMGYTQLLGQPAVAMPFTETESSLNRSRYAVRGVVQRTGALVYQFAANPLTDVDLDNCDKNTWTRETSWPADFAFSWDEMDEPERPALQAAALRNRYEGPSGDDDRDPVDSSLGDAYPYDLDQRYRAGELALLDQVVRLAAERDIATVLLPLTATEQTVDLLDIDELNARYDHRAQVFDLYQATRIDLTPYWYDDAHLEPSTGGKLTTSVLADHLVTNILFGPGTATSLLPGQDHASDH